MLTLAIVLSLAIGVALGLLGGGGSILTIPILVYVLGVDPRVALPTSLLVVGATAAVAAAAYARRGMVVWRVAGAFGLASMAGSLLGGRLAAFWPASVLMLAFGILMLVTAVAMARGRRVAASVPARAPSWWRVAVLGALVGLLTGTLGAGGGFLIVPALVLLAGLSMREAIGTSLVVISMSSAAGLVGHLGQVDIDGRLAAAVAGAGVLGSLVGTRLAHRVAPDRLRRGFAWFVGAVAVLIIGRQMTVVIDGGTLPMPISAILGGAIIGGAAAIFLLLSGRIAGVSGIAGGIVARRAHDLAWRLSFVGGLVAGGLVISWIQPSALAWTVSRSWPALAAAGLLVGAGTALANGCTSGHGVCGVARFASRSIIATVTFVLAGMLSTFAINRFFGGAL